MRISRIIGLALAALVGFVALSTFFGSWYTVDQGERGVLLTNGAYTATVEPGLHFKVPFFQSIRKISVREQTITWDGESRMEAYSADQQAAMMKVSVNFHVPPGQVKDVYDQYGGLENLEAVLIERRTPQQMKTIFGQYNAVSVIAKRNEFNSDVDRSVSKAIDGPVIVDSVQVEDIKFSRDYEKAVEARMTAEVEVQKQQQQYNQEKIKADIAVTQAEGRARSVKAEADAKAYSIRVQGDAQAGAIKARAAALGTNPLIVELTRAERWDGKLPTTMLPASAAPFIGVK